MTEQDAYLLAERLHGAIGLVRRHVRRSAGRPWPLSALTDSQVEVVRIVRHNPGISVTEVAAALGLVANSSIEPPVAGRDARLVVSPARVFGAASETSADTRDSR